MTFDKAMPAAVIWTSCSYGGWTAAVGCDLLKELNELGVGFVSLTEALDLTTSTGQAIAGLLGSIRR